MQIYNMGLKTTNYSRLKEPHKYNYINRHMFWGRCAMTKVMTMCTDLVVEIQDIQTKCPAEVSRE